MIFRFSDTQRALAHLVVPFGETVEIISGLVDSIEKGRAKGNFPAAFNPQIVQLGGQIDLVFSIEAPSFRRLFRYNFLLGEKHVSCQWVLCKAFVIPASAGVKKPNPPLNPKKGQKASGPSQCFYVHLRIHRQLYQDGGVGAEQEILTLIARILRRHRIPANILAPVGWSDLLIYGHLNSKETSFCHFLGDLQAATLARGAKKYPIFKRTVSLLGYIWNSGQEINAALPRDEPIAAHTFTFRVHPGHIPTAFAAIREVLNDLTVDRKKNGEDCFHLDVTTGKYDIVATPKAAQSIRNVYLDQEAHARFVALRHSGVESAETHIKALDPQKLVADIPSLVDSESYPPCSCTQLADQLVAAEILHLGDDAELKLPSGLRESLAAVFALCRSLLRVSDQCCDLAPVINSCRLSLEETLKDLRALDSGEQEKLLFLGDQERLAWQKNFLDDLKIWCSRTEKVLGERAESFQGMFSQRSDLTSFRGNVQKYLVTADFLIEEFIALVCSRMTTEEEVPAIPASIFHFGATDEIESQHQVGVTTIPSKYLFSLPLAIPQLWQEASVRIFNSIYRLPFDSRRTGHRVGRYILLEEEQKVARKIDPRIMTKIELLEYLADQFADLIVRFFGFRDHGDFETYIVTLAMRSPSNVLGKGEARKAFWENILQRLLLSRECQLLMADESEFGPSTREAIVGARESTGEKLQEFRSVYLRSIAIKLVGNIKKIMQKDEAGRARRNEAGGPPPFLAFEELLEVVLERNERPGFLECHWQYMREFIDSFQVPGDELRSKDFLDKIKQLRQGELVDLSGEPSLNSFFLQGYLDEVNGYRLGGGDQNARGMAALGRSVYLSAFKKYRYCRLVTAAA